MYNTKQSQWGFRGLRARLVAALTALGMVVSWAGLTGVAWADGWPSSAAGSYDVVGNQSAGVLVITQFPGAAGSQCKPIRGTIYGSDAIEGFYCPGSGRIAFLRKAGTAAKAQSVQFWSGNLSVVGNIIRIGGTFYAPVHDNVSGNGGGSLGEYSFSAEN